MRGDHHVVRQVISMWPVSTLIQTWQVFIDWWVELLWNGGESFICYLLHTL